MRFRVKVVVPLEPLCVVAVDCVTMRTMSPATSVRTTRVCKEVQYVVGPYAIDAERTLPFTEIHAHAELFVPLRRVSLASSSYVPASGTTMDSDEFEYLQGCCAQLRGLYYTASDFFYYSDWQDWEARMNACVQDWPDKGEVYHNPDYRSDSTTLKIKVANQDEGYATYFKLYTSDGDFVSGLFVDSAGTVSTEIPGGVYVIKMGTGKDWYGPLEAFGDYGDYETLLFVDDEAEVQLDSGYEYTLTINTSTENPDADDVNTEYTDFGEF